MTEGTDLEDIVSEGIAEGTAELRPQRAARAEQRQVKQERAAVAFNLACGVIKGLETLDKETGAGLNPAFVDAPYYGDTVYIQTDLRVNSEYSGGHLSILVSPEGEINVRGGRGRNAARDEQLTTKDPDAAIRFVAKKATLQGPAR